MILNRKRYVNGKEERIKWSEIQANCDHGKVIMVSAWLPLRNCTMERYYCGSCCKSWIEYKEGASDE